MSGMRKFRLGTRASPLARWQAEWVAVQLRALGCDVRLVPISTRGDERQTGPIGEIGGGQGVFTKELQRALLRDEIDLAVHSLKDLPTDPVTGLVLAAVPPRGPAGDALVARSVKTFDELPPGAIIGTGSARRRSQLLHARPDLQMRDVRGNVDTRLRKLDDGEYDALVLAEAGLTRLGFHQRITQVLPEELMLPAPGQGALGIEIRADDDDLRGILVSLDDGPTRSCIAAERSLLAALRGGCLAPIGARAKAEAGRVDLSAVVVAADGARRLFAERSADAERALELGQQVAAELLSQGAAELIAAARD
jgi:hydroxymethylbilane synthase